MENKNSVTDRIKEKFIIIYDKLSKPVALSLRNSITNANETCVLWTEDVYNKNECRLTNRNLLVLLNEKMINEHLANPSIKIVNFSEGVILKHEGNTMGIMADPKFGWTKYLKDKPSFKDIATLLCIPVLGGYILDAKDDKCINDAKVKLLFNAVEKLKTETIEKFLRGELD